MRDSDSNYEISPYELVEQVCSAALKMTQVGSLAYIQLIFFVDKWIVLYGWIFVNFIRGGRI
jgi:hypothetical protein